MLTPDSKGLERMTRQTRAVLEVLIDRPSVTWWGFDLATQAGIRTGTVYPVLAKLERIGWLKSRWEEDGEARAGGRPRRRLYQLTGQGERAAFKAIHGESSRDEASIPKGWNEAPA